MTEEHENDTGRAKELEKSINLFLNKEETQKPLPPLLLFTFRYTNRAERERRRTQNVIDYRNETSETWIKRRVEAAGGT